METSEKAKLIIHAVKTQWEYSHRQYMEARVDHAKEMAAQSAWEESSTEDGPCTFVRNPHDPIRSGEVLNTATRVYTEWGATYDYAVSTFLDSLPNEEK